MRYQFLVISNPVAGREAEYNEWYDRQHVHDVLRVPGFVAAQRFKVSGESTLPGRYVAIYEMETDDPAAALAELNARAGQSIMPISDALDIASVSVALLAPVAQGECRSEHRSSPMTTASLATLTSLSGKVALVTGGGQGIGEAICVRLGEAGAVVVVTDINGPHAERTAKPSGRRRPGHGSGRRRVEGE